MPRHFAFALVSIGMLVGLPSHAQPLLQNRSFEQGTCEVGLPVSYGVWQGDLADFVEAENGVTPLDGSRMLKFLATSVSGPSQNPMCEIVQLVDLSAHLPIVQTGAAFVRGRARFNRVAGDVETDTEFVVRIRAYAGHPANFPIDVYNPVAQGVESLLSDDDPQTWQMSEELTVYLPVSTRYVGIFIYPLENVFNDASEEEFDGHYADFVSLSIDAPTPASPATWGRVKAVYR